MPGGFLASEAFRHAAAAQSAAWGFEADRLFVAHPIQDRTDAELEALADEAYAAIKRLVCAE